MTLPEKVGFSNNGHHPAGAGLTREQIEALDLVSRLDAQGATFVRNFYSRRLNAAPEAESKPRFEIHTASDALQPLPPIIWALEGIIPAVGLGAIYSEGGLGKSQMASFLGACVSAGKPFCGYATHQRKVLYVDEEMGFLNFSRRLGDVLRGAGVGPDAPFEYVCLPGFVFDDQRNADQAIFQALLEDRVPGLVIVDAWGDVTSRDENSKIDTLPTLNWFRRLAFQTGTSIIMIHHSGKNGSYRGSSAFQNAVDWLIRLERGPGNVIKFCLEKSRYSVKRSWAAVARWGEGRFTLEASSIERDADDNFSEAEGVIMAIVSRGPISRPEILAEAAASGRCSARSAKDTLYGLVRKGRILRINPGQSGRGQVAVYGAVEMLGQEESPP